MKFPFRDGQFSGGIVNFSEGMSLLEIHSLQIPWLTRCSQNTWNTMNTLTASDLLIPFASKGLTRKSRLGWVHDELGASVREPIWSYLPRFKISTSWVWMSKPLQILLGFLNNIDIVDIFLYHRIHYSSPKIRNSIPRSTELLWTWFWGVLLMGSPRKKTVERLNPLWNELFLGV